MKSSAAKRYLSAALAVDPAEDPRQLAQLRSEFADRPGAENSRPTLRERGEFHQHLQTVTENFSAAANSQELRELETLDLTPYPDLEDWRQRILAAEELRPGFTTARTLAPSDRWYEDLLKLSLAPAYVRTTLYNDFFVDHLSQGVHSEGRIALQRLLEAHPGFEPVVEGLDALTRRVDQNRMERRRHQRRLRRLVAITAIACVITSFLLTLLG